MVDIKKFTEEFNKEYDFMYQANKDGKYVAGTNEAVNHFDKHRTEKETEILNQFARNRMDGITSDREAAAFMFTVDKFIQ